MKRIFITLSLLLAWGLGATTALGQISDLTFTRDFTSESMVDSIEFEFELTEAAQGVVFDQLDGGFALTQLNDSDGVDVILNGLIDTIGIVQPGDLLESGNTFGPADADLNLSAEADVGDDVFLGFSSTGGDVGFFKVSFDDPDGGDFDGNVIFSSGQIAVGGGLSLTVAAVPEPSSACLLAVVGLSVCLKRRRA